MPFIYDNDVTEASFLVQQLHSPQEGDAYKAAVYGVLHKVSLARCDRGGNYGDKTVVSDVLGDLHYHEVNLAGSDKIAALYRAGGHLAAPDKKDAYGMWELPHTHVNLEGWQVWSRIHYLETLENKHGKSHTDV